MPGSLPTFKLELDREVTIPSRILIVDDHEIVRQGIRRILELQNDWEVCGEAGNGQEALQLNATLKPDAIIMDLTMPVMNGLDATRAITNTHPESKVLIFTMHEPQNLASIERSGAKGVLTKSRAAHDLTPALQTILAGQTYFD